MRRYQSVRHSGHDDLPGSELLSSIHEHHGLCLELENFALEVAWVDHLVTRLNAWKSDTPNTASTLSFRDPHDSVVLLEHYVVWVAAVVEGSR